MNGILVVDKPANITSHDIVDIIREKLNIRKVGHAGTLDPLATGVLVVLIGRATKLSNRLTTSDKEYKVVCLLGTKTDTDDLEGRILRKSSPGNISKKKLNEALAKFKGKIKQKVPRFSAMKMRGKKLYELARKNKNFKLPEKEITIYKIEVLDFKLPEIKLKINCSKGTYIRSICRDLGEMLGCGGCADKLRRTKSFPFSEEEATDLNKIRKLNKKDIGSLIIPIANNEDLQRLIKNKKD